MAGPKEARFLHLLYVVWVPPRCLCKQLAPSDRLRYVYILTNYLGTVNSSFILTLLTI